MTRRPWGWLAAASLAGAMAWFLARLEHVSHVPGGLRAHDIYAYFYPTMLVAARALRAGGRGLLWNPFQDCGQPFLGEGATSVLYPPALLALVVSPDRALYGVLFFNLTVGAIGAYLLCRELGVGVFAAWCGGLAFGLGNASVDVITATPLLSGPFAWMPAAMLFCERLLRAPTTGAAVGLGVTTALALLPGHPQLVFYLYQLIALRVLWQLVGRRGAVRMRTLGLLALGLALGPLLVAVQLVPNLEVLRLGTRNAIRGLRDISPGGYLSWETLRSRIEWRWDVDDPWQMVPGALVVAAVLHPARRRAAAFWALAAVLALVLAVGPHGPLFPLYMRLPLGTLFSDPSRFLLVTGFCLAVLVGIGTDAVVRLTEPGAPRALRAALALVVAGALVGYRALSPARGTDRWVIGCVAAAVVVVVVAPRLRAAAAVALAVALVADVLIVRQMPLRQLLPDGSILFARAPLLGDLRRRMTPQDRVYLASHALDFSLEQRTGSLLRVPVLYDYLPQPTRRWAAYFVTMRTGAPMRGLYDWGFVFGGWFPRGFRRPLLDLAAGRYVVAAETEDRTAALPGAPLQPVAAAADVRVYENPTALARARFVPRVEVVPDPEELLRRLGAGTDDLREVALVEEAPAGPPGTPGPPGTAEFVRDDPEDVVLRVRAPQAGFLFLADQDFPGWRATVDGAAAPITRANYVFRLVAVPAGDSLVEFRYRPASVVVGAVVSGVTLVVVIVLLVWTRRSGDGAA